METALYVLHVLVCLAMLPIILLQSGKGGGVSAAFGGGQAGGVFGARGASTFLTKLTTGAALLFMCTSLGLSWMSSRSRSVLDRVEAPAAAAAPADDAAPADAVPAPVPAPAAGTEAPAGAAAAGDEPTP